VLKTQKHRIDRARPSHNDRVSDNKIARHPRIDITPYFRLDPWRINNMVDIELESSIKSSPGKRYLFCITSPANSFDWIFRKDSRSGAPSKTRK
jgi:hypothetical protein